jgi:enoyl-CoA hydratase
VNFVLNRPAKGNSMTPEVLDLLEQGLLRADDDQGIHAVLISGSPACRDFCTGYFNDVPGTADPSEATVEADIRHVEAVQRKLQRIFDMHKPVVAKVHGRCIAGGTDLAFLCDIVIASEDARFGFPPHRDIGTAPINQWLYHCGPQWAKRLLLTGDMIGAADAAAIRLILKAVPRESLDQEAHGLMKRLAKIDPALLAAHKRAVNLGMELMGARTFQRLAAELDVRAHWAPSALALQAALSGDGAASFNSSLRQSRLEKFGDGIAHVCEPDPYDADGRLSERA